ncbi:MULTISPECIES: hypothetical protein [Burkholderia]|uniref:hypothetical protein n=1 Tax=Burkholderia TaxID=32008 RepID=UPI00215A13B0|nr:MULTISPECIES: hypothetical protein [Burkholderia]MCL4631330.1 hypothetical protein [Burkholderia sp.]MDF0500963.1 hypothetical protein [Burkholderia cenocepacia]UVE53251.1 hypothetical protein KU887_12260 [Burkholderia sp. EMB26]
MRIPVVASILLALVSHTAQAATSITIDAKQNCIQNAVTPGPSYGNSVAFQLAPGRYVMSLSTNTMSCTGGSGCVIDAVHVVGGMGSARWGTTVTKQPTVVDVGSSAPALTLWSFITDDVCADNSGQATLLIQTVN